MKINDKNIHAHWSRRHQCEFQDYTDGSANGYLAFFIIGDLKT
jgi:hypothetical protein